jgi:hypothetical protein
MSLIWGAGSENQNPGVSGSDAGLQEKAMNQTADPVVIAALARTPMGGFQGVLSGARAVDLGAAAVRAAVVLALQARAPVRKGGS